MNEHDKTKLIYWKQSKKIEIIKEKGKSTLQNYSWEIFIGNLQMKQIEVKLMRRGRGIFLKRVYKYRTFAAIVRLYMLLT